MTVFGTRPEAIIICLVVNELKKREELQTVVRVTVQHCHMLDLVLKTFNISGPDCVEKNVSTKVVKIIQSYTGVVDKMVWRKG